MVESVHNHYILAEVKCKHWGMNNCTADIWVIDADLGESGESIDQPRIQLGHPALYHPKHKPEIQ